ncbi:MAG TPA: YbjN domain-containing protein [Candidatus Obscuribacterales bacterium]
MGIFGTKKASKGTVDSAVEMLTLYFKRRGLDIRGHELDDCDGYGWWITEGSAKIYIFLQEDRQGPVLRVTSPIVHFPQTNRDSFFLRCLDINRDLSGCCLAAFEQIVMVTSQRPLQGLDQEEVNSLIWNVSNAADYFDDVLAKEFSCRVYRDD